MSLTNRILIALVAGLSVGVFISWNQGEWLLTGVTWVEPIGTLWVNGIRIAQATALRAGTFKPAATSACGQLRVVLGNVVQVVGH